MSEDAWFNDPMELFRSDKILHFWPTSEQEPSARINATTRFVLYAACVVYLIKRDARVFVLAAMVLAAMFVLHKKDMIKMPEARPVVSGDQAYQAPSCQRPTFDNPMGNVLLSDYIDQPNRPPACDSSSVGPLLSKVLNTTIPFDAGRSRSPWPKYQRNAAARQFVTAPVSNIPGDQTGFAESLYGKKYVPTCREDPSLCDPNIRGAQLELFAGLDYADAPRH